MITVVPFVTAHAIERYQDRVDSCVSRREALRAIREILAGANRRSRPRHWTKVDARPGCRYLYSADHPDICLVLRGGAVVTVFSRASCSAWCPSPDGLAAARPPAPYRRHRMDLTEFCEAA
jgi:hypothetical protein